MGKSRPLPISISANQIRESVVPSPCETQPYNKYILCKHTNDDFFYNFPKISEESPKVVQRPDTFPNNSRKFPKISEEDPMMFRSHGNTSKFSLSQSYCVTTVMVIFSISSLVKEKNSIFTAHDEDMIL